MRILLLPALAVVLLSSTACAQANPRAKALADAVARGDKALAGGDSKQAGAAWSIVLAFEPNHPEAKKKIDTLPGEGFSLLEPERVILMSVLNSAKPEDWCGFPMPTPAMDLVAIQMISDLKLLPSLRSTSFSTSECSGGSYVFLGKPSLTASEVKAKYGKPQSERKDADGEVMTYGRFRVIADKDGHVFGVLFPPFNR